MAEVIYRQAQLQDIPQLCECRKIQLLDEGIPAANNIDKELEAFFTQMLRSGRLYQVVGEAEGKIVSTGGVVFYSYPPSYFNVSGGLAYVTNMYTAPEYRKQGLATKVLGLLDEEIKRRNVTEARLGASKWGKGVYQECGFFFENDTWMTKRY